MEKYLKFLILISGLILIISVAVLPGRAATVDELKQKSASLSDQIKQLDAEIANINKQLTSTQTQKSTLNNELKKIETTRKSLLTELTKTEKQISLSDLNLQKLSGEISDKERNIDQNRTIIAKALRNLNNMEQNSLIAIALSDGQLSDIIQQIEDLSKVQVQLNESIASLKSNKETLEVKKDQTEEEKKNLTSLKSQLADQKQIVDQNKKEKDTLLARTKSQEATYQQILADKMAKRKAVEQEMADIEAQIKIAIDPNSLPKTGSSPLIWPLNNVIITQYFGNTTFATQHAAVYSGKGHNGIDLGIPVGSIVKAASDGIVMGAGDTDNACQGASYGKWILIKHNNGLSTLYGHLSLIKVSEGQTVIAGQTIAYSGNTGYSTGPHLHFTVYASEGVKVSQMQSKVKGCGMYILPLASYNSYLNPLSYLPPVPK